MAVRLGSAYGYIKIDAKGVQRGVEEAKSSISTLNDTFAKVGKAVTTFGGLAAAEIAILKKVFAFGKEGAELERLQDKFDRLAASVGTTGAALRHDLRQATNNLISDSKLAASAVDFLSLGLAKNHDETVRLTRVAGALNMNMNQLVLTLTNMTTMRFDALGISVDGFDQKVKALERSGLSAAEAFKEAFLQQAEEQLQRVGDVADSSVAPYLKMERAIENLSDKIKNRLAPSITDAAIAISTLLDWQTNLENALRDHHKQVLMTAKSYEDYRAEMERVRAESGYYVDKTGKMWAQAIDWARMYTEAEFAAIRQTGGWTQAMYAAYRGLSDAQAAAGGSIQSTAGQLAELERTASGSARELDGLIRKQDELKSAMDRWMSDTAGQVVEMLGRRFGEASNAYRAALAEVDAVLGSNYTKQLEQKDALQKLVEEYAKTKNLDAFREGLQRIREDGLATMKSELESTTQKAGELYEKLLALPDEIKVKIKFDVEDYPDWLEGEAARNRVKRNQAENFRDTGTIPTPRAIGGPIQARKPYRWQEGLGGELLISERSGHILNQRQVERLLQSNTTNEMAEMAAAVRALAERATNIQINGVVRDDRDVEALAWRTSQIVMQRLGG